MIFDSIANLNKYERILPKLKDVNAFLIDYAKNEKPDGRYDIDGDNLFALVQSYETSGIQSKMPESHKKYIDVQVVVSGAEYIGYKNIDGTIPFAKEEFSKGGDIAFYDTKCETMLYLDSGVFAVFFQNDGHMPCVEVNEPAFVKKIVFKILDS